MGACDLGHDFREVLWFRRFGWGQLLSFAFLWRRLFAGFDANAPDGSGGGQGGGKQQVEAQGVDGQSEWSGEGQSQKRRQATGDQAAQRCSP